MRLNRLLDNIQARKKADAVIFQDHIFSFQDIVDRCRVWKSNIQKYGIVPSQVIAVQSDYSFESLSLFLALLANKNIVALLPEREEKTVYLEESKAQGLFYLDEEKTFSFTILQPQGHHELIKTLQHKKHPGFIIFSSGSTGKPKAILHDLERFLIKFDTATKQFRTMTFLLFDHIAGLDTLFYTLVSGAPLIFPENRDVASICSLIEKHQIEVLPTSPTFLNLLCLSGEYERYNLSSLKIITYGSEPMSETLLARVRQILPQVTFIQKYGTSEFGSPKSRSKGDNSLWLKLDSNDVKMKIVDKILWIKSNSSMMGYLNAPNRVDEQGWFCTEDEVEVDGEWIRILGRKSEIINVGGEKVYPSEVENVLLELDNIKDIMVYGEPNSIMGNMVCAKIELQKNEDKKLFTKRLRKYCRSRLPNYKIPIKINLTKESLATTRHKKKRM